MLSLFTLAAVSKLTDWLFHSGKLHPKWDYFRCVVNIPEDRLKVDEPHEGGELTTMTAAMVAKYCAMDEMNGRVNPAMTNSDTEDEEEVGGPGKVRLGGPKSGTPKVGAITGPKPPPKAPRSPQVQSEDEEEKRPAGIRSVKQYQTKL